MLLPISFSFDNTYVRQLGDGFGVRWAPAPAPAPSLLFLNRSLAAELGLESAVLRAFLGIVTQVAAAWAAEAQSRRESAVPTRRKQSGGRG